MAHACTARIKKMKCRYWVAFISHFRYFLKKAYFQSLPYYFCKLITWKNSRKSDLWFSFNMRRKMDYFDMSLQWGNFLFILVITLGSFSCSFSRAVATDSNLSIPIPVLESRCILKTWHKDFPTVFLPFATSLSVHQGNEESAARLLWQIIC